MSIYKTPQAKDHLAAISQQIIDQLDERGSSHLVPTRYGDTYCLEFGDSCLPKLVIFHGGYTNHAFILYYLRALIGRFHIFALDMPGHPGKSSETIIDPRDDSYGHWACEALEQLAIDRAHVLGLSYGGFVSQRLAALKPDRVASLTLIVSAGICGMNQLSLIKNLMLPQILFRLTKSERYLNAMLEVLFTDYDDAFVVDFFRTMLSDVKNDSRQMKLSRESEFAGFLKPVLVITAEHDAVFDAKKQARIAAKLFPNVTVWELEGSKHSPSVTAKERLKVSDRITKFILGAENLREGKRAAKG